MNSIGAKRVSAQRAAAIAVLVLLLAGVRSLGEIHRLHAVRGDGFGLADALPYVNGGIMAVVGALVAGGCYVWGRYKLAIAVVIAAILLMLAYKLVVIGA
ncbi:MAG TPA: hypothetical protein VJS69_11855 [Candidatus Krumholzibacteria bacterium]|nr:hypothetical protein [Candidatus Krumholzibacteria bacterium]